MQIMVLCNYSTNTIDEVFCRLSLYSVLLNLVT